MSLKNLLALQAQKKATETPAKAATPATPAAEQIIEQPAEPVVAKPKGLGLNLLGAAKAVAKPSTSVTPYVPPVEADAIFSLDDLAGMDETAAPARRNTPDSSGFDDEIEATAPDRELPEGLTAQQIAFVEQLDGVYGVLHDPEMFAQSVRIIMMELQENAEYQKLVSDQDVHTMIRGMRNSMGLARVKKQEKSRKTGTATKAKARKVSAEMDSAMALLSALDGDDD